MPEEIIENGVFKIPLFHGTSTLFLESIQTHGLGGVKPLEVHSVRAFVKEAYELCDAVYSGDEKWEDCKFSPQWLINQECFSDNANFQHGDTYLATNRACAVRHALKNSCGSELLTTGAFMVGLIRDRRPELIDQAFLARNPVMKLISSDSKPILVTVRNVSADMLLSEGGENPEKQIEKLKTLWSIFDGHDVPTINFRLRCVLPLSSPDIEYLDPACEEDPWW